ncbi:galactoside alpha-(1,2)-fucosyltransferase 2-like [Gigantopelta aegis]|uniref:galactoside alpha-(1,2)-fucosyltransferase 2-like n=1 Tax=Gigantopelta aegis TaxID=1735272 RepID=UPI001B88C84E|nr:galactoside alpha-(1,2)-fucosyltransferase 2-like [Gigantopelta aegis]
MTLLPTTKGLTFLLVVFAVVSVGFYVHWIQDTNDKAIVNGSLKMEPNQPAHYICDVDTGRLGNQMFSYAASYGIAKDKNMTMFVAEDRMLNGIFVLDATKVEKMVCDNTTLRNLDVCCTYKKTFLNFATDADYKLGRYLQSWKYFQNHVAAIRRQFRFKKPTVTKAQTILHSVMGEYKRRTSNSTNAETPTFVGVHIRRGDINSARLKLGFTLAPKEYITKAMGYFTSKFSKVIFLVCSDSVDWVKSNFNSSNNIFYSVGNSPEVDMCLLSSCNHSIMTVGTFGWWGSFLADGKTVYYKHAAREGSELRRQYSADYSDYFYQGWIGMD